MFAKKQNPELRNRLAEVNYQTYKLAKIMILYSLIYVLVQVGSKFKTWQSKRYPNRYNAKGRNFICPTKIR